MTLIESKEFASWLMYRIALYYLIGATFGFLLTPVDSSDESFLNRSGVGIRTDAATGCEYFTDPHGGIVARMEANGQQRGCRRTP